MSPTVTRPDSADAAEAAERDRQADLTARFVELAKQSYPNDQRYVELCAELAEVLRTRSVLRNEARVLNRERYGPRYESSGLPSLEHDDAISRLVRPVAERGAVSVLPSDLPEHVHRGEAKAK